MSTLAALRQKIKAIQTTKKITHAVRLTSMSFYSQMEKRRKALDNYTHLVEQLFRAIVLQDDECQSSLLFSEDLIDQKPLYIIISTTKGLCGSLNSNLFRYTQSSLCIDTHQKPSWIAVGQKAIKYITDEPLCTYPELTTHNAATIADDIMQQLITTQTPFSSVTFFYSEFKSIFIQKPCKKVLLPYNKDQELENSADRSPTATSFNQENFDGYEWEQEKDVIAHNVTLRYMRSKILTILFQALITEHAARFVAMDTASTNADKMLDRLTIHYNKLRQALITKEVSELAASGIRSW